MKNSKGISMVTLVITIVVMIILASIVLVASDEGTETADRAKIMNEKKLLQEAAQSRFSGYMRNSNTYPLEGVVMDSDLDVIVEYLNGIGRETAGTTEVRTEINSFLTDNSSHAEYNRIINYSDMLALEITNVSYNMDYSYIVNYYSLDVIGPIY